MPFVVIGGDPQDVSYQGTPTRVEIGDHNVIRENVTINRATEKEDGVTRVGSHNMLMAGAHVAHDCKLGDHVTIANGSMLGGHCHVESYASISGGVAVHHFTSIGSYSFIGGQSRIYHDVPPYMLVDGNPSRVRCINVVGLKRNGISPEGIDSLHEAHRFIYRAKMSAKHAAEILESHGHLTPEVRNALAYVRLLFHPEDDVALLRRTLEQLATESREVIVLRELEGLSYQQIATVTEVPIGTVMSRLSRARRQLQKRLAPCSGGEGED